MLKNAKVLMAEDDPAQAKLFSLAIKEAAPDIDFTVFPDGREILSYLESCTALPALVILDSKLPAINGLDASSVIKEDPRLSRIPVVIFSASEHPEFYRQCYESGANSCLQKPADYDATVALFRDTINYWARTNRLPE